MFFPTRSLHAAKLSLRTEPHWVSQPVLPKAGPSAGDGAETHCTFAESLPRSSLSWQSGRDGVNQWIQQVVSKSLVYMPFPQQGVRVPLQGPSSFCFSSSRHWGTQSPSQVVEGETALLLSGTTVYSDTNKEHLRPHPSGEYRQEVRTVLPQTQLSWFPPADWTV